MDAKLRAGTKMQFTRWKVRRRSKYEDDPGYISDKVTLLPGIQGTRPGGAGARLGLKATLTRRIDVMVVLNGG